MFAHENQVKLQKVMMIIMMMTLVMMLSLIMTMMMMMLVAIKKPNRMKLVPRNCWPYLHQIYSYIVIQEIHLHDMDIFLQGKHTHGKYICGYILTPNCWSYLHQIYSYQRKKLLYKIYIFVMLI